MRTLYAGSLDRRKLPKNIRSGLDSYYRQKKEQGVSYSLREFIVWWLENLETFTGKTPTCGRIDHSKPYSWDNILMQDRADNSREAALRNRLGPKTKEKKAKKVSVYAKTGEFVVELPSIRDTALFFGVSQRSVQFAVRGVFKSPKFTGAYVLKAAA